MNKKWCRNLLSLMVVFVALTASKLAFAYVVTPPAAPEIDPRLAIEGLALAGAGVALVLERIRRRR
jgi:hypothetical protein